MLPLMTWLGHHAPKMSANSSASFCSIIAGDTHNNGMSSCLIPVSPFG